VDGGLGCGPDLWTAAWVAVRFTCGRSERCVASFAPARHHGEIDSDDLYGLPLDRFVAERGALARTLRAGGRRDEAAGVAGLRKPSIAAWAVNQLVRTQRGFVEALFEAGHELRDAQAELLAGRGAGRELRAAGERERVAVDRLVDAARGLLTAQGEDLSPTVLDRVADTLHAAALDPAAREQTRSGRLERELRHAGLGFEDAVAPPPPSDAKGAARPIKAASEQRTPAGRDRLADSRAKTKAAGRAPPAQPRAEAEPAGRPPPAQPRAETKPAERAPPAESRAKTEPTRRARPAQPRAKTEPTRREHAAQRRAEAERLRREHEAALAASRAAEAAARRRAESATRAVKAAEEHRGQAAQALRDADEALAAACEEAATAEAALRLAQAELRDA
jgi:hypothetical protein